MDEVPASVPAAAQEQAMDIEARAGEPFDIAVEQLGTAGYQWLVEPLPPGVVLVEERSDAPPADSPPGSPAHRVFSFRADQPGAFEVVLVSKRVWETQPASRRTFRVEVR